MGKSLEVVTQILGFVTEEALRLKKPNQNPLIQVHCAGPGLGALPSLLHLLFQLDCLWL